MRATASAAANAVDGNSDALLAHFAARKAELTGPDRPVRTSLSGTDVPKLSLPRSEDQGDLVRWLRSENLPGYFPYTAGVFPLKREGEDPARMFAGEGGPARTNRRFHLLSQGQPATRLSTAFDSVTLYGRDPAPAPDVYGKVGTSGVSIAIAASAASSFENSVGRLALSLKVGRMTLSSTVMSGFAPGGRLSSSSDQGDGVVLTCTTAASSRRCASDWPTTPQNGQAAAGGTASIAAKAARIHAAAARRRVARPRVMPASASHSSSMPARCACMRARQ